MLIEKLIHGAINLRADKKMSSTLDDAQSRFNTHGAKRIEKQFALFQRHQRVGGAVHD
jgi:hypothetical protein